jgi:tRNA threonylcarbamoyladenosine biosynthesis protein TsaE
MQHTRSSKWARARPTPAPPWTREATLYTLSEDETYEAGRSLSRGLRGGEVILLDGELGTGKTVFARGVAAGLGVAPEDVNSPSFTLVQEYRGGRVRVVHVDLYRLDERDDLASLGLDEILGSGAVVLVEWGDKLPPYYRRNAISIRFHDAGEGSRRIDLLPGGRPDSGPGDDA